MQHLVDLVYGALWFTAGVAAKTLHDAWMSVVMRRKG